MRRLVLLVAIVSASCGGSAFTEAAPGADAAGGADASVTDGAVLTEAAAPADAAVPLDAGVDAGPACVRACPAGFQCVAGLCVDAVGSRFSPTANPSANWSYGWQASLGSSFKPFALQSTLESTLEAWVLTPATLMPSVFFNAASTTTVYQSSFTLEAAEVGFYPGPSMQRSVVRWTSPAPGTYTVDVHFVGLSGANGSTPTTVDVALFQGVTVLTGQTINTNGGGNDVHFVQQHTALDAASTLDFSVGWGNDMSDADDATGLRAVIIAE